MLLSGGARAANNEKTTLWTFPILGQGDLLLMDLPGAWNEVMRDKKDGIARFRPRSGVRAELTLRIVRSDPPDPEAGDPARIREQVEQAARDYLDQAVESRYTIRELRGPQTVGFYWTLRDRMPKKKTWAAYVTRGQIGAGSAFLDFTLLAEQSDLPELRQALKMLAGLRREEPWADPPAQP
jgi:hypothetical protein